MRGVAWLLALVIAQAGCADLYARGRTPSSAKGWLIGGASMLAASYYFSAAVAHAEHTDALYVPVVGPFVAMARGQELPAAVALGELQLMGAVFLVAGVVVMRRDHATRVDRLTIAPTVNADSKGFAFAGRF